MAIHLVALTGAWLATLSATPAIEFVIPEVELVSPAPPESADAEEEATTEVAVETPEPAAPEPEPVPPEPEVTVEEEPEPSTEEDKEEPEPVMMDDPPTPAEIETPDELAEEEAPAVVTEPEEEAEETGEEINVRLEGVRRDYPLYYENIIRQINRCFRRPATGSWETTIGFAILADGSVTDARFLARSGNAEFDFRALRAVVDCAGKGRFGPLPEELPYDRLPVAFDFKPSGGEGMEAPPPPATVGCA